jgi:hypothetical protein
MGWRDELTGVVGANVEDDRLGGYYVDYPSIAADLLAMPPADRIALARELLAGTGRVVAREVEVMPDEPGYERLADGWNAALAAMLDAADENPALFARRAAMLGDEG